MSKLSSRLLNYAEQNMQYILLVLAALVAGIYLLSALQHNDSNGSKPDVSVFGESTLVYCSELSDERCNPGVWTFNYVAENRQPSTANLYGYDDTGEFELKIDEVEIKLNKTHKKTIESDLCIYRDDGDELIGVADEKIVCATKDKKTILFEGMNVVVPSELDDDNESYSVEETFFIVPEQPQNYHAVDKEDAGEIVLEPLIKSSDVRALNTQSNSEIAHKSSHVNRSVFEHTELSRVSKEEFLDGHSEFTDSGSNRLKLSRDIIMSEDVVIPPGLVLTIEAGVAISIDKGLSFLSYSPVNILGSKDSPVTISSSGEDPYGTFSVLGDSSWDETLTVSYVRVSNGSQDEINGAFMSGQMNFYRVGSVAISNSDFSFAKADDGLNVKNSKVIMRNNKFGNNSADAFDGDFVTGVIEDNVFVDNGNDGLDFSGSTISPARNIIVRSGDKCVSVGEASVVTLEFNVFDGCLISVEAKDSSRAIVKNNIVVNSREVAFSSYIKKSFFGEPTLEYYDNLIYGNSSEVSGLVDYYENNQREHDVDNLKMDNKWYDLWKDRVYAGE